MSDTDQGFVHLHVHTDFSKLDGLSSPESVVDLAHQYGMPAVAITDHGTMGGVIKAVARSKKIGGPNVIPGCEVYHAVDRFSKSRTEEGKQNYHLILLAVSDEGYRNLMRITSASAMHDSFYFNPRVDLDLLRQYSEGIVCTTSCLGSAVNQALVAGNRELAKERAQELLDIFGPDRFFIEVQDHGIADQLKILEDQVWLAKELGVGLLASQDSHYDHQEDHVIHDALLTMQSGSQLDDPDRFKFESNQQHFRTAAEMIELFPESQYPGAIANSMKIAEMAQGLDIPYKKEGYYLLPHFPIPDDFDGDEGAYLTKLTMEGMVRRYGGDSGVVPEELIKQAEYELGVIIEMGFPGYFLILGDGLSYLKSRGHVLPPGRGSAAGSIVSYAMNITNVPPNEHGLFFERFLNPGRRSMPDADIDLTEEARTDLIRYYVKKYGAESVAKIGTIGTFKARESIKSSCRIMGIPATEANRMTSMYPANVSQVEITLNDLMKRERSEVHKDRRRQWSDGEAFRDLILNDTRYTKMIKVAMGIEGTRKQVGVHAGGLLITPGPVSDYFPTRQDEDGLLVTLYDKDDVEDCGGVKIDLLGLKNLSIVQRALQLIQDDLNIRVDLDTIPFDDPGVYRMLAEGSTDGVFQLSSDTMRGTLKSVGPTSFADISAVSALVRPGPMSMNTHMEYGERKNGRSPISAPHPEMMDILGETYGLVVYQEQVMALARHFAGYSLAEADDFRKAMGKKLAEAMEAEHDKFMGGVVERGYPELLAQQLWDVIEPFSGYAFNKAHSVAYGYISYWTAYLSYHYPAQYAAACIEFVSDSADVLAQVEFARRLGTQVYAPNINKSRENATTSTNAIWLGMNGIKFCGAGAVSEIVSERDARGEYKDLGDLLLRTRGKRVTRKNVEGLIYVGAFDDLHPSRKVMIDNLDDMIQDAKLVDNDNAFDDGDSLFDLGGTLETVLDQYDLSGKDYDRAERSRLELLYLGFFAGRHPFTEVESLIADAKVTGKIPDNATEPDQSALSEGSANIYGILTELQHHKSKNGRLRSTFVIETAHDKRISAIQFGFHLSDSLQGSFVNMECEVRAEDSDFDGDEGSLKSLVATASRVQRIELDQDDENAPARRRRAMRAIPGALAKPAPEEKPQTAPEAKPEKETPRARRQRKVQPEPIEQETSDEVESSEYDKPMIFVGVDTPSEDSNSTEVDQQDVSDPRFRFYVTQSADLGALSNILKSYGPGNAQVIIHYGGSDITHEHMKYKLNDDSVEEAAVSIGVQWERA